MNRFDDELYSFFRLTFPTLQVDLISEDEIKSPEQKEIWRPFLMNWERKIEDFNFGTLLRLDSAKEYTPDNTCVGLYFLFFFSSFLLHNFLSMLLFSLLFIILFFYFIILMFILKCYFIVILFILWINLFI